jgi:hypothetical protein
MIRAFWKFVCLFAWRRWVRPGDRKPAGVPGNRDPENPCDFYEPRKKRLNDWDDCLTDGHYLCRECVHQSPGAGDFGRSWINISTRAPE